MNNHSFARFLSKLQSEPEQSCFRVSLHQISINNYEILNELIRLKASVNFTITIEAALQSSRFTIAGRRFKSLD